MQGFVNVYTGDGLRVAPFKAQNMSNDSGVTLEGLEMGQVNVSDAHGPMARDPMRWRNARYAISISPVWRI